MRVSEAPNLVLSGENQPSPSAPTQNQPVLTTTRSQNTVLLTEPHSQTAVTGQTIAAVNASNSPVTMLDLQTEHAEHSVPASASLPLTESKPNHDHQASEVLENYLLALKHNHCSAATIRNYKSDINQFLSFSGEDDLKIILTKPKLTSFIESQQAKALAPATIKRKLISIAQFSLWAKRGKLLGNPDAPSGLSQASEQELFDLIEYRTPIKPKVNSRNGKPQADIVLPMASTPTPFGRVGLVVPYVNLALIAFFMLGLGYFGFQQLRNAEQSLAFPTTLTRPERVLSFQGRLLDQGATPIVAPTQMRFRLYDNLTGGNLLWDSNTCTIDPDVDGIFNTSLGGGAGAGSDTENCGAEIADSVFTENSNVWLQVSVGAETLSPRQPIQTVAYALNSETLQGFPASASAVENTVLIMNNNGEVVLGNSSPVIKATGDSFTLEGKELTIQTPTGSNTDINLLAGKDIVFDAGNAGVGGAVISRDYFSAPGATFSATYAGGTALTIQAGPTPTADIMRWQTNTGTNLGVIKAGGDFGIGTDQPEQKLTVSDSIQLGTTDATRYIYFDNGTGSNSGVRYNATTDKMQFSHDGITWTDMLDTSGVVTSVSNVDGTLTINPTTGDVIASLNLGNANTWTGLQTFSNTYTDFAQYLRHEGDTNTYIEFTPDVVGITAGGKNVLSLDALSPQNLVTVGNGTDIDTRVLADGSVVGLFVEGSSGRVGIGNVTAPGEALEIGGTGTIRVGGLTASLPVKTNANKDLISGAINLASAEVTGVLPIANGGTNGSATPTAGTVAYGNGTSYAFTGVGNQDEVLISNGSSAPSWVDVNSIVDNYWSRSAQGVVYPRTLNDVVAATSSATTVLTATQQNNSLLAARLGGPTDTTVMVVDGLGNVGIGNVAPNNRLTVGALNEFQVNSFGAIAAATGITSSGTITFTGLITGDTNEVVTIDSGVLESRAIDQRVWGSSLADGVGQAGYNAYWSDENTLGAEQYVSVTRGGLGSEMTAGGAGELIYSTSTTAYETLAAGTSGFVLQSNGAAAPAWVDINTVVSNFWDRTAQGVVYPATQNDVVAATSSATTVLTATQQNSSLLAARLGGTTDSTVMVVDGSGNVGIGTGTSGARFNVRAAGSEDLARFTDSSGNLRTTITNDGFLDLSDTDLPATFNLVLKINDAVTGTAEVGGCPNCLGNGFIRVGPSGRSLANFIADSAVNSLFSGGIENETYRRFAILGNGDFSIGNGAGAWDTNLGRNTNGGIKISTTLTTAPTLMLKETTSQTADLFQVQSAAGSTGDLFVVDGSGNVSVGDPTPANKFTVGPNSEFQIDSAGEIAAATGITSSGDINFTGINTGTTDSVIIENSGLLEKRTIDGRVWGTGLIDGSGTGGYVTYWQDANSLTAEQYLNVIRGGLGADMTAAGAGEVIYSTSATTYDTLAAGTSGYVLSSNGAAAPAWVDPNLLVENYWSRTAQGVVYPRTLNDVIAATSSATTVLTATQQNSSLLAARLGGTTAANQVVITGTGQVGVGTTPHAEAELQVNGDAWFTGGSYMPTVGVDSALYFNSYYDGSDRYYTSDSAFEIWHSRSSDTLQFQAAVPGTAGNAPSFNAAITINSSAQVGIGNSGPNNAFTVGATNQFQINSSGAIAAATGITSSGNINFTGMGAGTTDSVVIQNAGLLQTRTIDSRVWGSTLVDGSGTTGYNTYWSDANTLAAEQYVNVTRGGLGADVTAAGAGELLYSTSATAYDTIASGTSGFVLQSNGAAAPSWVNVNSLISNYWGRTAQGVVYPSTLNDVVAATSSATTVLTATQQNASLLAARLGGTTDSTVMVVDGNGNVGIGDVTPGNKFAVGPNSEFQVSSAGAIAAATGITSSGSINFTGMGAGTTDSVVIQNAGLLQTRTIDSRVWGSTLIDGSGTTGYNAYWSDPNTLAAEQYVGVTRGGLGADMTAAGAGEIIYSTSATAYDTVASGTLGYVLTSGGAGAPTWTNPSTLGTNYWARTAQGILVPVTLNDGVAATTSATTALTATQQNGSLLAARLGGTTNYLTVNANGNIAFTNAGGSSITSSAGLAIDGTGAVTVGGTNATSTTVGRAGTTSTVNGDNIVLGSQADATNEAVRADRSLTISQETSGNVTITNSGTGQDLTANRSWTLGWTGQLAATRGGTGYGSYTVGDMLYADSTTSLARLADVATGNVMLSGGVSTAPSWGKVGLTTHVSGVLPIANGGTNSNTTLNNGRVMVSNGGAIVERAALSTDTLLVGNATTGLAPIAAGAGTAGQILVSGGPGVEPSWSSTLPSGASISFTDITSGINTQAAMTVSTGASLTYSGTGTINASSLQGATWEAPGTIGSTTPNTGAFTTLSANATGNALTLSGAGANIAFTGAADAQIITATNQDLLLNPAGTGNVGINNTTPTAKLTITSPDVASSQLLLRSSRAAIVNNNVLGGIDFASDDTTNTAPGTTTARIQAIAVATHTAAQLATDLAFSTTTGTTMTEVMRLDDAGNVGIRNTNPSHKLTIANTADTENQLGLRSNRSGITANEIIGGIAFISNDSSLTAPGLQTASIQARASVTHTLTALDTELVFSTTTGTTTADAMKIDGAGRVLIGNTGTATSLFNVGATNQFQVSSTGSIDAATGITSSGNITFSGLAAGTTDSVIIQNAGLLQTRTIDSRVWGSSLVDGSGTSNYVTYWSDANTLAAEQYLNVTRGGLGANMTAAGAGEIVYSTSATAYDSLAAGTSGYVLRSNGAAAPSWVDVNGLISAYWTRTAQGIIYPTTLNDGIAATSSATTTLTATQQTASLLAARIGGTTNSTVMVVEGGGDVGIGLVNPAYKLDVAGDINFTGALRLNGSAGTSGQILMSQGASNPVWQDASAIFTNHWTRSAQGVISPVVLNDVVAATSSATTVLTATQQNSSLLAARLGGTTANTTMVVNGSGNVGIGTLAPVDRLNVVGTAAKATTATNEVAAFGTNDTVGTNDLALNIRVGGNATQTSRWTGIQSYENGFGAQSLALQDLGGNVGIGNTDPSAKLTIASTSDTENQIHLRSNRSAITNNEIVGGIGFISNDTTLTAPGTLTASIQGVARAAHTLTTLDTGIVFNVTTGTTLSEAMRIDYDGQVGIATNNPVNKLSIANTADSETQIELRSNRSGITANEIIGGIDFNSNDNTLTAPGINTAYIRAIATAAHTLTTLDTAIVFGTTTGTTLSEAMRINPNNTVSINNTNSTYALDVAGDVNFTGALRLNGSAGTSGQLLVSQGAANPAWQDATSIFTNYWNRTAQGVIYPSTLNDVVAATSSATTVLTATQQNSSLLAARLGGTTAATSFVVEGSGDVGIGTLTPTHKLTLAGTDSSITLGAHIAAIGSADTRPLFQQLNWTHDNISMNFDSSFDGTNWVSSDTGSSYQLYKLSDVFRIRYDNVTAGSNLAWNEGITLNTSGNVGIGTASQTDRLNVVSATAKATASTYDIATFGSSDTLGSADLNLALRVGGNATQANRWTGIQSYENGFGVQDLVLQDLGGNVGIGTTTPLSKLHIVMASSGVTGFGDALIIENNANTYINLLGGVAGAQSLTFGRNGQITADGSVNYNSSGAQFMDFRTGGNQTRVVINNTGQVGIGTSTSLRGILDVNATGDVYLTQNTTTGTTQSNFLSGHVYLAPYNATNISYLQARRSDNSGTTEIQLRTYNAGVLTEAVRIDEAGNLGIKTTNPLTSLQVVGNALVSGTGARFSMARNDGSDPSTTKTWHLDNSSDALRFFQQPNISTAGTVYMTIADGGNVGIGAAPGASNRLDIYSGASQLFYVSTSRYAYAKRWYDIDSTSYYLEPGNTGIALKIAGSIEMNNGESIAPVAGGSISITTGTTGTVSANKITANTIDPPYWINGTRYATYAPSMIGVNEEIAQTVTLAATGTPKLYKYVIDFDNLPEGSPLWLYSRVIDLDPYMRNLHVLVSSDHDAKVFYKKDLARRQLVFFGTAPAEISYRLTAPRFDQANHGHISDDQLDPFGLQPTAYQLNNVPADAENVSDADLLASIETAIELNLTDLGLIAIETDLDTDTATLVDQNGNLIERFTAFTEAVIGKLRAGMITTRSLTAEDIAGTNATISGTLTADQTTARQIEATESVKTKDLTATGETTLGKLTAGETKLGAVLAETATVSGSLTVSGQTALGSLTAQSATVAANLTTTDLTVTGTASIATGRLAYIEAKLAQLETVKANTAELTIATVSGMLYAENIADFDAKVAKTFKQTSLLANLLNQADVPPALELPPDATQAADLKQSLADLNLSSSDIVITPAALFIKNYFEASGNGYVAGNLGIGKSLVVGNGLVITENSIAYQPENMTSDTTFSIQPAGRGKLSLLGGVMRISEGGLVEITGDLWVAGNIRAELDIQAKGDVNTDKDFNTKGTLASNTIRPLNTDEALQVKVSEQDADSGEIKRSRFEIVDELGTPVATISADGKARFAGLSVNSEDVSATGSGTLNTSQSAGKARLTSGQTEIILKSESINSSSLIYVTPLSSTSNQVLYVKSQVAENPATPEKEGEFRVGVDVPVATDIEFNWWIVN